MKFLVSVPVERSTDGKWTTRREPVVPCFPTQHTRAFLAVPSFKLASKAVVEDIDYDPDVMAQKLADEYPGLPRKLHENYVIAVFKAVSGDADGNEYGVSVSQDQAFLIESSTGTTKKLWDKQPVV